MTDNTDIAILGGGLAGLTLAYLLRGSGQTVTVLEARRRLGGRIYSHAPTEAASIEMGATWLGGKHRHLTALLDELGLATEPQVMDAHAWYEASRQQAPALVTLPPNPDPSMVLKRGSSALIAALAARLPEGTLRLDCPVTHIEVLGEGLLLEGPTVSLRAKRVVSTLPPNLFCGSVTVSEALPAAFTAVAQTCHTWMADSIKVGVAYRSPFWRKPFWRKQHDMQPASGTLFSNVGPLTEGYDHSHVRPGTFALKGFADSESHTWTPGQRRGAVIAQLCRVYGDDAREPVRYEECVWRAEPYTYAPYGGYVAPHQHNGHPALRAAYLGGRLLFGGSETAAEHPGYMDGAVEAAGRCAEVVRGNFTVYERA